MGQNSTKEKSTPAQPPSEETERQLAALSRQEAELSEKQSRYQSLLSQLEEDKAKVAAARKALSEALSQKEASQTTLQQLHARLQDCEAAASRRKVALEELTHLSKSLQEATTESQLQSQLEALQSEMQQLTTQLDSKTLDFEQEQSRLKDTEKTVSLLEKLEEELEHQLGEEASKHEHARKKAYLRGLFLLMLRKAQIRSLKTLHLWRKQAHQRASLGKWLGELAWAPCPDLESLKSLLAAVPSSDVVSQSQSLLTTIEQESQQVSLTWKDIYTATDQEVVQAALISACSQKQQQLETLLEALGTTAEQVQTTRQLWQTERTKTQEALELALQGSAQVLRQLQALPTNTVDGTLKHTITLLTENATAALAACQHTQLELRALEEHFHSVTKDWPETVADLRTQLLSYQSTGRLTPPQLQSRSAPQDEIAESVEVSTAEEPQVATAPEEEMAVQTPAVPLPPALSAEDRESLLASPTLKALQFPQSQPLSVVPTPELLLGLENMLKLFTSPTRSIWETVLEYFTSLHGRDSSLRHLAEFAFSLQHLENLPYVNLLTSALGLSLQRPVPLSQAYGQVMLAAALEGRIEDTATGGEVPLVSVIKAVRRLFESSPEAGREALARLKPASMEDHRYMNFVLCVRLKEVKKESMQLFKVMDTENTGKLTCPELVTGLLGKLEMWVSADLVSTLFSHIDKNGTGSITRIEFAREVSFATYLPLEKELTVNRLHCMELLSGLIPLTSTTTTESLSSDTRALLQTLADTQLVTQAD